MTGNRRRVAGIAAVTVLVTVTGTACSRPHAPHKPGTIAFVVGGRNNMPHPQLVGEAQRWLRDAVLSKDKIVVVGVSGKPEILLQDQIQNDCDSKNACDSVVTKYSNGLADVFNQAKASSPEADTLGAIQLAARNAAGSGPHRIVVIDNGLQTTGALRLNADGALSADPKTVVSDLSGEEQLAFLAHTQILLTGLGSGHAPQNSLSPADDVKLGQLWKDVLTAGGASVQIDDVTLPDDQPIVVGMPPVSVVKPDDETVGPDGSDCYRIRADKVGFLGDEPTFKDPAKAVKTLTPIAKDLIAHKAAATVIGTTAYPESSASNPLSHARADAVATELVKLGVDKRMLITGGVGTKFPGYRDPLIDGVRLETLAQQNRLVIIAPVGVSC